MKKIFIFLIIFLLQIAPVFAKEELVENESEETLIKKATEQVMEVTKETLGISDFLEASKEYTSNIFENLSLEEIFSNAVKGKTPIDFLKNSFFSLFGKEILDSVRLMTNVLIIIIIHSVMKAIIENLGNNSSAKIAYFVQYLAIVTLVIQSFSSVISITKEAISNLTNFMNLLIPLLSTLILTTGCITISNIVQPILIFLSSMLGVFFNNFLIPLLLVSISLSIVSNISSKIELNKLSKFFKSSIVWILGITLTIFTCLLSVEGTLGSSVDALTAKTTKAAVSNFIPVVGKILGDTTETIIGCSNILKNAVGVIGLIIIIGIVLVPIVKILTLWLAFCLTSAICEVIADEKIVKLTTQISDSYKILLAILFSVSAMFLISITLVLKITNNVVM